MKRIRLAILILLIPLCCIAFAALTKTTSIGDIDWIVVLAGDYSVDSPIDISGSYDTILYLEIAYTDNDSQDGVDVQIGVSYGDDNWVLLTEFTTPSGDGNGAILDGAVNAGGTTVTLDGATNFVTPGQKFFIDDDDESESVRIKSEADDTITLCHDLKDNHAHTTPAWAEVYEIVIPIPAAFAYVRVLIFNVDANADIHYLTWSSKVTAL